MYEDLLREIGLTEGEIRVYLALAKLGRTTTGPLMTCSKISSSKVYLILDKLIRKGLTSYTLEDGVRFYENSSPKMILNFLDEKQKRIEGQKVKALSFVKYLRSLTPEVTGDFARIYKGPRGVKLIHDDILDVLKSGEEYLVIGAPVEAGEKLKGFWDEHNKKRIDRNIGMKIIVNHNHPQILEFKNAKYTKVRVLDKSAKTPSWIVVYKDISIVATLTDETILFYLKNKATAQSYREFFKVMWAQAKVV